MKIIDKLVALVEQGKLLSSQSIEITEKNQVMYREIIIGQLTLSERNLIRAAEEQKAIKVFFSL